MNEQMNKKLSFKFGFLNYKANGRQTQDIRDVETKGIPYSPFVL